MNRNRPSRGDALTARHAGRNARSTPHALLRVMLLSAASLHVSACSSIGTDLPLGPQAYSIVPERSPGPQVYRIGPGDTLSVTVHREPELSAAERIVDPGGYIDLPLAGSIRAAGMTAAELSDEIAARLT